MPRSGMSSHRVLEFECTRRTINQHFFQKVANLNRYFFDEMAQNNMAIEQDRSGSPMIPAGKPLPQIENKGLMARA